MTTFLIGLVILIVGGALYGGLCQRVFRPDDRKTPAYERGDGVDFVPMPKWKNALINLLNIAGTGPILGPIQGILFGPIAFLTIPIGCVIGGAVHDYFSGMVSLREGGIQMPEMVRRNMGKAVHGLYTVFVSLVLFLVGVVFIYTPGDIAATQVFGFGGTAGEASTWIIYGVIFVYYLIATLFPIDKIIGRIYPIFGAILLVSAVGIFTMLLIGGYPLLNLWDPWVLGGFDFGAYFTSERFIPAFFVTVACGILSGFHSTQITLVTRTLQHEKEGRFTFYNMMIIEGFIAMVWAAGAMAMIGLGAEHAGITMQMTDSGWAYFAQIGDAVQKISATSVVGVICRNMLGPVGGIIAIIGVIILPITSGDTALRSLRLILSDALHIRQDSRVKRILLAVPIFAVVFVVLIWAKVDANGFNTIWRYFGWSNQTLSIFALSSILIWFLQHDRKRYFWIPLIPLVFYSFITCAYILNARIGLSLPYGLSIAIGVLFAVLVAVAAFRVGNRQQHPEE
ncbi:MAG: carbon starvation protein A [Lachnospiraceae bacterium]|nr:carbon starvation protein A [Lachnospiraceae bacterium]